VALQQQAEEIRLAELRRAQARLGSLSAEQIAAIEALTRGLVNKFLHPPMQALKQAARENNAARVEALCESWSLHVAAIDSESVVPASRTMAENPESEKIQVNETSMEGRS
jgi:glutamyl-tRNA reductase